MADSTPKSYHTDPTLYLYTSLTSGSSHIISATSRMQTILKANRVDFQALDVATDEKARMLWGRRAGKRKLPGLVRFGMIVGDLEEVEEWNEYGELKENVNLPGPSKAAAVTPSPSTTATPSKAPSTEEPAPQAQTIVTTLNTPTPSKPETGEPPSGTATDSKASPVESSAKDAPPVSSESTLAMAMRQAGFEAAKKAGDAKTKARQDELERLKAKSADLEKQGQSPQANILPSSGGAKDEVDEKSEVGSDGPAEATEDKKVTEEEKEGNTQKANDTEPKDTKVTDNQTALAAEAEMTNSANAATAEAAEPNVLQNIGQAQPEKASPSEESAQPTEENKPPHILNAREAEEETNKAIIADEATHVHIAGSPPPYASPGIKPPKVADEDDETSSPSHAAFKEEIERKEVESEITAVDSKDEEPEREDDEEGAEEHVKTNLAARDESKNETLDVPSEPVESKEEAAAATANTASKKPEANAGDEPPVAEESKPVAANSAGDPPKKDKEKEEEDDDEEEEEDGEHENKEEEEKKEEKEEEEKKEEKTKEEDEEEEEKGSEDEEPPKSKPEEQAPPPSLKSETEPLPKTPSTPKQASNPVDTATITAHTPIPQADPTSANETKPETKTQAQPAASGDRAGKSVDD